MKYRCESPASPSYQYYGAKDIKVCDEWQDFDSFYVWSINNGYTDDLTIERIDVSDDYGPHNCEWIPKRKQARNKTNTTLLQIDGVVKTLYEWCKEYGLRPNTVRSRMKRGWTGRDLLKPAREKKPSYYKNFYGGGA